MKDPTRGGVANLLNEWSEKSKVGLVVREEDLPIDDAVVTACERLGIVPLVLRQEGHRTPRRGPRAEDMLVSMLSGDFLGHPFQDPGYGCQDLLRELLADVQ